MLSEKGGEMFSRDDFVAINYVTAQREMNLDASFIYVQGEPGFDYYELGLLIF